MQIIKQRKLKYLALIITTGLLVFFPSYFIGQASIPTNNSNTPNNQSGVQPYSFLIFTDGIYFYAKNGSTGAIQFGGPSNIGGATGTNSTTVTQDALNTFTSDIGGVVEIEGQVNITGVITISTSNTTIETPYSLAFAGQAALVSIKYLNVTATSGNLGSDSIIGIQIARLSTFNAESHVISGVNLINDQFNGILFKGSGAVTAQDFTWINDLINGLGIGSIVDYGFGIRAMGGALGQMTFTQSSFLFGGSSVDMFDLQTTSTAIIISGSLNNMYTEPGLNTLNFIHVHANQIVYSIQDSGGYIEIHSNLTLIRIDSGSGNLAHVVASFSDFALNGGPLVLANVTNTSWASGYASTIIFSDIGGNRGETSEGVLQLGGATSYTIYDVYSSHVTDITDQGGSIVTPNSVASGATTYNTHSYAVNVCFQSGTFTSLFVNGVKSWNSGTAASAPCQLVPAGQNIAYTNSTDVTWKWFGLSS